MSRIIALVFALIAVGNPRRAESAPVERPSTTTVCIAVIEPEVSGDPAVEDRKALAASMDGLLTESLARCKGFTVVDRQSLDVVLTEKASQAAGLVKVAPEDVAAPLRPFWAAGALICCRADAKTQAVVLEAVSAQTGQLLAGIYLKADVASADEVAKAIAPRLESFARDIHLGVARLRDKPLLETSGRITGSMSRLAWMVDDLVEATNAKVAACNQAIPLVPRRPTVTKEERLLRIMGLGEARQGDAAAGLSPVPHVRFSFELTDSAQTGISFEKTPIALRLSLRRGDAQASQTQIDGSVGQWQACRDKAADWLARQLAALSGNASGAGDELQRAKRLAEEELLAVSPWSGLSYQRQRELDLATRGGIARRVLRAAHLDPTSEPAAYLAACYVDALYPHEGKNADELSLVAIDRAMVETRRYLDRFAQKNVEHHLAMFQQACVLGVKAAWRLAGGPGRPDAILRPPDARQYPYVSFYVRAMAEHGYLGRGDKRYDNGNSFSAFSFNLIDRLVPCIPAEKLDEEYEYWRTFYATRVGRISQTQTLTDFANNRPAPWELVDAVFQARNRNPQGVREAFQRLARQFPRSETYVWGGDQGIPPRVSMLLKAAADPDWETWQPQFKEQQSLTVGLDEMTQFMHSLAGRSIGSWELDRALPVPAVPIVVPEGVRKADREPGCTLGDVEALAVVGDDLWMITPASAVGSRRWRNHLWAAKMKPAEHGKILLDPVEIPWPPLSAKGDSPIFVDTKIGTVPSHGQRRHGVPIFETVLVTEKHGATTVWIGTQLHALARFDRVNGGWRSRWYTETEGFPSKSVDRIASCRSGSQRLLVLVSSTRSAAVTPDGSRKPDRPTYVWTLNPQTHEVRLLLDGSKLSDPLMSCPAAVTKQGKSFLVEYLGRDNYDLDVEQVQSFRASDVWGSAHDLVYDEKGQLRLFQVRWDAGPEGDFHRLDELSLETFRPLPTSAGRSGGRYSVFPLPETRWVFGRVGWRSGDYITLSGRWPAVYGELAVGRGGRLWIGFSTDAHAGTARWLTAYRPARAGEKDWAATDQWVGPFRVPDGGSITRIVPCGEESLLLTTDRGMYVVDCPKAVEQAVGQGHVCSTRQWRSQYEKRLLASGWKNVVPLWMEAQKWDRAAQLLEAERKRLRSTRVGPGEAETHVDLWEAHLQARKGDLAGAIRLYDQVAARAAVRADKPAEVFARMNQVILLFKAERFQEMLALCRSVNERFPQTVPQGSDDRFSWYINEARRKPAAKTAKVTVLDKPLGSNTDTD